VENMKTETQNWHLGIDCGLRSIGFAAIEVDDEDTPIRLLTAVSFIHDGGIDPDSQVQKSRKATAGVARRTRKLRKRRTRRIRNVEQFLIKHGLNPDAYKEPQTYEAWDARYRLVNGYIKEPEERKKLLSLAIMHIAHFRGWRNPWKSIQTLSEMKTPSYSFEKMREEATLIIPLCENAKTIGELGYYGKTLRVRPRQKNEQNDPPESVGSDMEESETESNDRPVPILSSQVRQEDIYYELELICDTQRLEPTFFEEISNLIFYQEKPSVPVERVGRDALNPDLYRAHKATLEFQEFRIQESLANIRITENGKKRPLTEDESKTLFDYLYNYSEDMPPSWEELALEILKIDPKDLNFAEKELEGSQPGKKAPINKTLLKIKPLLKGTKAPVFKQWWQEIATLEDRADFVAYIADPVKNSAPDQIERLLDKLSDRELEEISKIEFKDKGRAAYSRETLEQLNDFMADNNCDLYEARKILFNLDENWHPPLDDFEIMTGQPAVDRNLAIARKFMSSACLKWGKPKKVVLEVAREAGKGAKELSEIRKEQGRKRNWNERVNRELEAQINRRPSSTDRWKYTLIQLFNSTCLYCGTTISFENCELDHIVPRAEGGASIKTNLAAICRNCNASKGRRPFAKYADECGINLQEVLSRVEGAQYLERGWWKDKNAFKAWKKDVIARLKRKSIDEPLDERQIASTAYAAVALRDRIISFLGIEPDVNKVAVFSGRVTAAARGFSKLGKDLPLLRLGNTQSGKSRLDRRHHAVDAAILTTITPRVAQKLMEFRDYAHYVETVKGAYTRDDYPKAYEVVLNSEQLRSMWANWKKRASSISALLGQALEKNDIAVINPLRLRPKIGAVHKDTIKSVLRKPLGSSFTKAEINRIIDRKIYNTLIAELADGDFVEEDNKRTARDEKGNMIGADTKIEIFSQPNASIFVQQGQADLFYVHHARIYAWHNRRNQLQYGMLRVFGGEFGRIGFMKPNVDIFTAEIPRWSESWRTAETKLQNEIMSGNAKYIGWLVDGDELEFASVDEVPGTGEIKNLLKVLPVSSFRVDGFMSNTKLRLRPLSIASEGLELSGENPEFEKALNSIIKIRGWLPAVQIIMSCDSLKVIRRTYLGKPRWKAEGLPVSWSLAQRLKDVGLRR
jgi:CRISPR-associated endonuclease Csn1